MNAHSNVCATNLGELVAYLRLIRKAAFAATWLFAAISVADDNAREAVRAPGSESISSPGTTRAPFGIEPARQQDLYDDDLPAGAVQRLGTTRFHNRGRTEVAVFSPDGRFLAAGGEAIRIFDATTGRLLEELGDSSPAGSVARLAFSADGRLLATGDRIGGIRAYSIADGKQFFAAGHPGRATTSVAFLPDGQTLVSFGGSGEVRLWDTKTGEDLRVLDDGFARPGGQMHLAVSGDGKLVAASSDNGIRIWDIAKGSQQAFMAKAHEYAVTDLAFTTDGGTLLSCGTRRIVFGDGDPETRHSIVLSQIRSWNVKTGEMERELLTDEPGSFVGLAAWDDRDVLVAATDKYAIYLASSTGETLRSVELPIRGKPNFPKMFAVSPDASALAVATGESAVQVVDLETGSFRLSRLESHAAMVRAIDWSLDGNLIVTGSSDGTVRIWDALTSRPLQLLEYSDRCMNLFSVAISPDCELVAVAGNYRALAPPRETGAIKMWHAPTGRLLFTAESREAFFNLAFSEDGKLIAAARFAEDVFGAGPPRPRGSVEIYRTNDGENILTLSEQDRTAMALSFAPSSTSLISVSRDGTIRSWELPSGKLIGATKVDSGNTATISPSGTKVVTALRSVDRAKRVPIHTLTIRDSPTGKALHTLQGGSGFGAHALEISTDGKLLVSGCQSDILTVWSMETGAKLVEFSSPQAKIFSLAFDPTGRFVVTGMDDGTAVVWDVSQAHQIVAADE